MWNCTAAQPSAKPGQGQGGKVPVRLDRWTSKGKQGEVFTLCVRGRDNFEFLCKIRDTLELATLLPADKVALYRQQQLQQHAAGAPRISDGDDEPESTDDNDDDDDEATLPPTPQPRLVTQAGVKQEHAALYTNLSYCGVLGTYWPA